ncbi:Longitudinals lacking protein, isoforms A/B/D/L [Frankliniella fusca]|uniref:Longitudinals lacking protein, isoforms A/B/D/L n=1 Tax=Frankliniella fusca TaxID=407009 RepID=A0AAE1LDD0_9NEOP|nr:Longitudinals lacking protein, isoforms A/B/D/L [Frankliniella fusca]
MRQNKVSLLRDPLFSALLLNRELHFSWGAEDVPEEYPPQDPLAGVGPAFRAPAFPKSSTEGFACAVCGKRYRWKRNLNRHVRVECGKEPSLQCPCCPYRTKHKSSLSTHMHSRHGSGAGTGAPLSEPTGTRSAPKLSRFWQNQFLKEARRGSAPANSATNGVPAKPAPPPPMTPPAATTRSPRPRSGSPRSPRSPAAAGADGKVLWLPELMRRRSLDLRDGVKDSVRDLSLPKSEEDMVALDMSASIVIQHAEEHGKDEDDENEQALLDATPGEGPGAFPCSSCGKVYRWKRTLRNHLRSECGKEPQFQCPYCHLRSKRKSNIYAHIRVVHHKPV